MIASRIEWKWEWTLEYFNEVEQNFINFHQLNFNFKCWNWPRIWKSSSLYILSNSMSYIERLHHQHTFIQLKLDLLKERNCVSIIEKLSSHPYTDGKFLENSELMNNFCPLLLPLPLGWMTNIIKSSIHSSSNFVVQYMSTLLTTWVKDEKELLRWNECKRMAMMENSFLIFQVHISHYFSDKFNDWVFQLSLLSGQTKVTNNWAAESIIRIQDLLHGDASFWRTKIHYKTSLVAEKHLFHSVLVFKPSLPLSSSQYWTFQESTAGTNHSTLGQKHRNSSIWSTGKAQHWKYEEILKGWKVGSNSHIPQWHSLGITK